MKNYSSPSATVMLLQLQDVIRTSSVEGLNLILDEGELPVYKG